MNRGTFLVHKSNPKTANTAQKNQGVMRASTILNSSMMFGKSKRGSKMAKGKAFVPSEAENEISASKNSFLRNRRKSKTFVEKEIFKNKLASAIPATRNKILNP
jgi:hypothetical protein